MATLYKGIRRDVVQFVADRGRVDDEDGNCTKIIAQELDLELRKTQRTVHSLVASRILASETTNNRTTSVWVTPLGRQALTSKKTYGNTLATLPVTANEWALRGETAPISAVVEQAGSSIGAAVSHALLMIVQATQTPGGSAADTEALKNRLAKLENELSESQASASSVNETLASAQAELGTLNSRLVELSSSKEQLGEAKGRLETIVSSVSEERDSLFDQLEQKDSVIRGLEARAAEIEPLQLRVSELEVALRELTEASDAGKPDPELEHKVAQLERAIQQRDETITKLQRKLEATETDPDSEYGVEQGIRVGKLEQALRQRDHTISELRGKQRSLSDGLARAQTRIQQQDQRFTEVSRELADERERSKNLLDRVRNGQR